MAKKESSTKSVTFDAIVRQIREKQFAPVYLLHGEEPFFIDRICKMFEESILEPDERDFNQVVLYGKDTSADMVLANARQFPFGSPYRVVILKEAKELKNIELLDAYVQNPSPQTIFIVCHKYGKLRNPKAYNAHGVVFVSEGGEGLEPQRLDPESGGANFQLPAQSADRCRLGRTYRQ